MMPPTSIDGTDITGATIDGTDVQEITVDGQTVFQAVTIPNSAINQYKLDEGSGTTVADSIASNDLTTSGSPTWYSDSDLVGGQGLDFDGSDDEAVGNYIPGIGGDSAFSIAFTLDLTRTNDRNVDNTKTEILQNMKNSNREDSIGISFGNDNTIVGDVEVDVRDSSAAKVDARGIDVSGQSGLIRVCYTWDGANSGSMYVDTTENSTDFGLGAGGNITGVSGGSMTLGSTDGGEFGDIALDNVIFYDEELTQSEVQQDFDAQPFA